MIFTFFITIVFIAELIIMFATIGWLYRLSKKIISMNQSLDLLKPGIKDCSELVRKISEQVVELTKKSLDKIIADGEVSLIKYLANTLAGLLLWKLNIKLVNKFRKSTLGKIIAKGAWIFCI